MAGWTEFQSKFNNNMPQMKEFFSLPVYPTETERILRERRAGRIFFEIVIKLLLLRTPRSLGRMLIEFHLVKLLYYWRVCECVCVCSANSTMGFMEVSLRIAFPFIIAGCCYASVCAVRFIITHHSVVGN